MPAGNVSAGRIPGGVGMCLLVATLVPACTRRAAQAEPEDAAAAAPSLVAVPSATAPGAPRPGMVWVPPGVLVAGTPLGKTPRIADEELPGAEVILGGFYIDELPYPNEAGAIPLASVTRDEAARLCEAKSKRLCSELEWERACKGPANTAYEYGDTYRAATCGTGLAVEQAARRPSGERTGCKSGFGVREMHGGVWEWTDSTWERGEPTNLAVLRGGNAAAGEIVGRCANALARPPSTKNAGMGFRCCAGPRNEGKVQIAGEPPKTPTLEPLAVAGAKPPWGPVEWRWRPVPHEELRIRGECHDDPPNGTTCVCRVYRPPMSGASLGGAPGIGAPAEGSVEDAGAELASVPTGKALCGIVQPASDTKDLRMLYMDGAAKSRTVRYAYGRVVVSVAR